MDSALLATKLQIPLPPRHVVDRGRLVGALEHAIPRCKLTLLSAPAGYGKTTLLAQWAYTSHFPVAWLSLEEADNNLERFLRYLLACWETSQPALRDSPVGLLLGSLLPDSDIVLPAFINTANEIPDHLAFILDDYHLIKEPSIHEAVTFLLDHLPPRLHFVLAGRAQPPLPLARYRARRQLMGLGPADLQFSPEESAAFLRQEMGRDLAPGEAGNLHTQLEGWAAGLQLAALSLRRQPGGAARLAISGRHRFIADYLSQEVVAALPDRWQQFLLQTSILERLCGSLCDAVTGDNDGQEMLASLERDNLFLTPLDDNRQWFRYHPLFASFLRHELDRGWAGASADLHRRAARWHLNGDLPEPAFQHAIEGQDAALVIQILERYLDAKLLGGEVTLVQRWIDALPEGWLATYPDLGLAQASLLLFRGALDLVERRLQEIEEMASADQEADASGQLARVTALRCFIACFQNELGQAERYAEQALRDLPAEDLIYRAGILGALGDTYRANGHWRKAQESYSKLLDFGPLPAFPVQLVHVYGALADLELRQGHLRNAAGYWRKALAAVQDQDNWGRLPLPLTGWVYIRLGELLYERNELAEAGERLSQGLDRVELGGDVRALIAGYLIAARLQLTVGDLTAATGYLEKARPLVEEAQFAEWRGRFERCQLELWLAQDKLRTAVNWADARLQEDALVERPESEMAQLAIARVLILKGDGASFKQARLLLERLLQSAQEEGRLGVQIEALALQALGHERQGERPQALIALEHALRLAQPEGYVRLFADLGLPLARLLQAARARAVLPDYVARLLAAFSHDLPSPALETLPEPLTAREQEILEMLAAGLTNRQIADQLVISPQTVKKHTGNIYGKLGVNNRTGAVARAREVGLLE
jgi:LuxR family transcriptional regulator, maltose regulon positive regulatory protein